MLTGLTDSITSTYVNDATVTCVLKDKCSGDTLATVTLAYVAASNGNYRGILSAAVTSTLTSGQFYVLEITSTSGTNTDFRRDEEPAEYAT